MIQITKDQVLYLHEELIKYTGGSLGVRDMSLLESSINSPYQTYDGKELFPSIQQKAARLGFGIVSNHPFIDGNKRVDAHTMLVFLELNSITLNYTQNELVDLFLELATGKRGYPHLLHWIIEHQNKART